MLIVIDVGNTNITIGFFENDKLINSYRTATDKNKTSDEMGLFFLEIMLHNGIKKDQIESVIISSVVPPVMHSLENAIKKFIGKSPVIITSSIPLGISILMDNPKEVGADRIVNAIAAYELYGGPAIIIDFGTATTFCAIDEKGDYLGGVIYPGMKISIDALVEKTAKLPKVEIEKPASVIGKNTVSSMQSGIIYGYVGMVDYVVKKMKREMNAENAVVIATGGLAKLIAEESETIQEINRDLTLIGLKVIYEKRLS